MDNNTNSKQYIKLRKKETNDELLKKKKTDNPSV